MEKRGIKWKEKKKGGEGEEEEAPAGEEMANLAESLTPPNDMCNLAESPSPPLCIEDYANNLNQFLTELTLLNSGGVVDSAIFQFGGVGDSALGYV